MQFTVNSVNSVMLADLVNDEFADGRVTTVNGRKVKARFSGSQVAKSWQNGTVSVTVEGRERGKVGEVFVKVGQTMDVQ